MMLSGMLIVDEIMKFQKMMWMLCYRFLCSYMLLCDVGGVVNVVQNVCNIWCGVGRQIGFVCLFLGIVVCVVCVCVSLLLNMLWLICMLVWKQLMLFGFVMCICGCQMNGMQLIRYQMVNGSRKDVSLSVYWLCVVSLWCIVSQLVVLWVVVIGIFVLFWVLVVWMLWYCVIGCLLQCVVGGLCVVGLLVVEVCDVLCIVECYVFVQEVLYVCIVGECQCVDVEWCCNFGDEVVVGVDWYFLDFDCDWCVIVWYMYEVWFCDIVVCFCGQCVEVIGWCGGGCGDEVCVVLCELFV